MLSGGLSVLCRPKPIIALLHNVTTLLFGRPAGEAVIVRNGLETSRAAPWRLLYQ